MIVSASNKTDIPAFYGRWFIERLRAGHCSIVNTFSSRTRRVSLTPDDVDGFVFWSKNIGPFVRDLARVHERGFPFIVHHTVNNFPRALETSVIQADAAITSLRRVRDAYGPRAVVWRYDPVVFSSLTPPEFHLRSFEHLAAKLRGVTDEALVSFTVLYNKTRRNLNRAAVEGGFTWWTPPLDETRALVNELVPIAASCGMRVTVCAQPEYVVPGASEARCVDARRLSDVAGREIFARLKGNRPGCGCYESVDIGDYDSCPHGCVYCYAVRNPLLALARYRQHDPGSEFLFEPPDGAPAGTPPPRQRQLALFSPEAKTPAADT